MTDFEKQLLRTQRQFVDEVLAYMKKHDGRLQRIEQYNLQLAAVFDQASERLHDV